MRNIAEEAIEIINSFEGNNREVLNQLLDLLKEEFEMKNAIALWFKLSEGLLRSGVGKERLIRTIEILNEAFIEGSKEDEKE